MKPVYDHRKTYVIAQSAGRRDEAETKPGVQWPGMHRLSNSNSSLPDYFWVCLPNNRRKHQKRGGSRTSEWRSAWTKL